MSESFQTLPLQTQIPSYLYQQYSDDQDLQAFVSSFNGLSQSYLDWFNNTPLGLYTSPGVSGSLLDWIGQGIYGIPRPVVSNYVTTEIGEVDSVAINTLDYNALERLTSGTSTPASDDIYKRVLTWILYRGDGFQMSIEWVKRRIIRYVFGSNGSDVDPGLTQYVSLVFTGPGQAEISFPSTLATQNFQILLDQGFLPVPFQVSFTVNYSVQFANSVGTIIPFFNNDSVDIPFIKA